MIYRTLRDPDADEMKMMLDLLADPGPGALPFLIDVEPDYEAMATVMNTEGWTCNGHEPGAWCDDCKRLQLETVQKMWRAGIGGTE